MNIAYVCREFGPVTGGGIGTYVYNVCQVMSRRGHRIFLITDCFNDTNIEKMPLGIELVYPQQTRKNRSGDFFSANQEYSYRIYDTLRFLIVENQLDVVEFAEFGVEGFATIRAKRLLGEFPQTKLIVKLHTPSSLLYEINEDRRLHIDSLCDYYMEDYCVKHADQVTSPSLSLGKYFAKRVGRNKILQCPYPMELRHPDSARDFTEKQIRTVRLIGSVQVRKGIDSYIKAAIEVLRIQPEFKFEIWGADRSPKLFGKSYSDICKKLIPEEFEDDIVFSGACSYNEIASLYLDSCICVYPSRWENWANVCLEAMSFGCVVLVSKEGGMSEMVEHGKSGYIIDPLDPHDIATTILSIYSDPQKLYEVSRHAISASDQLCDPERAAQKIEQNYLLETDTPEWRRVSEAGPLVSVVIPYFNQPGFVESAVLSAKESDYPNLEIIVVNDGSSTTNAQEVFRSLADVTKVAKDNGGLSSARNAGIQAARGDFILPLDADDLIDSAYIKKGVEALLNNPELGYVSCHTQNFGELHNAYIPVGYVPELMPFFNTQGKCCNLYRKQLFTQGAGYDEVMTSYEDWDFLLSLAEKGVEGDVLPEELFHYRRHFDSMVYSTANRQRADLIQYMMIKHKTSLGPHATKMAVMLSRLWKETEVKLEFAEQQIANMANSPENIAQLIGTTRARCQVYSRIGGGYWEHNSVFVEADAQRWVKLSINLPFAGQEGVYRFDPCNVSGCVAIREIGIVEKSSGKQLFRANRREDFSQCTVAGTAQAKLYDDFLVIISHGEDPQIHLPAVPGHLPVILSVVFYFETALEIDINTLSADYQRWSRRSGLKKICKQIYHRFLG